MHIPNIISQLKGIILLLLLGGMIVMFVESAMESYKDWVHPKLLIMYNQI